ncbi:MAG: FAD-binding oxidoreductase [Rhodospirillales bacterium]|nr:FAD-binding oxidoreductase [Rhodospirillales bacterium]MBO6785768.1 FAD-binding oxidoreductase [Rhodospirillales bacterium]
MSEVRLGYTVVGAGIVGICTALSLQERGQKVTLIDPNPPAEQASYGNAGVISTWSCVPQSMPGLWKNVPKWLLDPEGPISLRWSYLPKFLPWMLKFFAAGRADRIPAIADALLQLHRPTVDIFRQHLAGTGHEDLVRDSMYVFVYRDPAKLNLDNLEWRLRLERGVPLEQIDGKTLADVEPDISHDYKAAVLIKDQGRAYDPGAIGKVLVEKFQNQGGTLLQSRAHALKPVDGGVEIVTDDGTKIADKVVLAAGPWSATLLKSHGLKVPLEAERGYHIVFTDPGVTLNNSIMVTDAKFVVSSMAQGVRCAGTAEFAGLDHPPDYRRAHVLAGPAKRLLPNLNTEAREVWMGQRPSFPDTLPAIGEVPGMPGVIAAFGHGHTGLTAAPMTGRLAAMLAVGDTPNIDVTPYSLSRFGNN